MLSLTGNQLSGEIPANIPQLTFLENNRFTKQDIKNFMVQEKNLGVKKVQDVLVKVLKEVHNGQVEV